MKELKSSPKQLAAAKKYYEANRERRNEAAKAHYQEHKEEAKEYQAQYRKAKPEKWKNWYEKNRIRSIALHRTHFYYRRLKSKVLDNVLCRIYEECPEGYHIDHIEPLNGKDRSGLHTPWNLQYLLPDENGSGGKGNKIGYIAESAITIDWQTMLLEERNNTKSKL